METATHSEVKDKSMNKAHFIELIRAGHIAQAQELYAALGISIDLSHANLSGVDLSDTEFRMDDLINEANISGTDFAEIWPDIRDISYGVYQLRP